MEEKEKLHAIFAKYDSFDIVIGILIGSLIHLRNVKESNGDNYVEVHNFKSRESAKKIIQYVYDQLIKNFIDLTTRDENNLYEIIFVWSTITIDKDYSTEEQKLYTVKLNPFYFYVESGVQYRVEFSVQSTAVFGTEYYRTIDIHVQKLEPFEPIELFEI
jgi:hypothetical protein